MSEGTQTGLIASRKNERTWTSRARALFLKHEWLRGYTLLSPTLLMMVCALALPIFTLVVYSFWSQDYVTIDETLTLKNYDSDGVKSGCPSARSTTRKKAATAVPPSIPA